MTNTELQAVTDFINRVNKGENLNQAQLVIQWDKKSGQIAVAPQNMTEAEALALLDCAKQVSIQHVLEAAKKSSGIVVAPGPLPKLRGD